MRNAVPRNAALADEKRRLIGVRASAALAERRRAGNWLGSPTNAKEAAVRGRRTQTAEADRFTANLLPVVAVLRRADISDMRSFPEVVDTEVSPIPLCNSPSPRRPYMILAR